MMQYTPIVQALLIVLMLWCGDYMCFFLSHTEYPVSSGVGDLDQYFLYTVRQGSTESFSSPPPFRCSRESFPVYN
ncbi:hypothetical protein HCUR_00126 [Holospora curviuscula]|uniref:Uncharacterized protein n=1 Tax=Holospora curviuscula TaxID=1082868 RepID=A0A2S5RHQ0_9PROT|nr:hypothetical protein HCUR_00126 [Holospora curviuscula]